MLNTNIHTDRRGAALTEYGIVVGLISVLSISAVLGLGEKIEEVFSTTEQALASEMSATGVVEVAASSNAEATPAPATSDFSFTSGHRQSGSTNFYGYNGEGSILFGSASDIDTDYGRLVGFFEVNTVSRLIIGGDHADGFPLDYVNCASGNYLMPATGSYDAGQDRTAFVWNADPRPRFTDGVQESCSFSAN